MGIVVAVKKKGKICIAADSLTISGGSRKHTAEQVIGSSKIIQCGTSYIGTASHPVWPLVLSSYFESEKKLPALTSQQKIFEMLTRMHEALKEKFYLNAYSDADDAFESSQFESLIVNSSGIFKTYELRSVQQFVQFAAIGSGANYALGALSALYDKLDSAEELAKAALEAAIAFDDSSALPATFHTVKAK